MCLTGIGGIFYVIYHIFFKRKNRCPICYTKRLDTLSPEVKEKQLLEKLEKQETKRLEKLEKKEERREMIESVKNKVKDSLNGEDIQH